MDSITFIKKVIGNNSNVNQKDIDLQRHKQLNDLAKKAQDAYYNSGNTIMDDKAYDNIFDEIKAIEDRYNYHPSWSVINSAGISNTKVAKAGKCVHEFPCLSQDKTKSRDELLKWLKDYEGVLSLKNDGNTIVLTYENGTLIQCASRGNGVEGQIITEFAKTQNCIPKQISDKGHVVVRGEFLMTYTMFNKLNNNLKPGEAPYKNPRNLATGTTTQLDMSVCKQRQGEFHLFELAKCSDYDKLNTYEEQLQWCKNQGFTIVAYKVADKNNLLQAISDYENIIKQLDYPTDGLVLRYNDRALEKLGYTGHAPRFSIAFKWKDDTVETILRDISWEISRTGRINPVALFDPVDIEGSTVQKASLNNITFIKDMKLGIGDTIEVFKANMIIPQVLCSHEQSGNFNIPKVCPSCGQPLKISNDHGTEFLLCVNKDCPGKNIEKFIHFASKNNVEIKGISSASIELFVEAGLLKQFSDFYDLPNHNQELLNAGYGSGEFSNLCKALDDSKNIEAYKVLAGLGIKNVGSVLSKDIMKAFNNDFNLLINADIYKCIQIAGNVAGTNLYDYFQDMNNRNEVKKLCSIMNFKQTQAPTSNKLNGQSFCITGSLQTLKNRKEFEDLVEQNGGINAGSVSKDLNFLVNNDINSSSAKNIKAKSLGIPIINENEFLNMLK